MVEPHINICDAFKRRLKVNEEEKLQKKILALIYQPSVQQKTAWGDCENKYICSLRKRFCFTWLNSTHFSLRNSCWVWFFGLNFFLLLCFRSSRVLYVGVNRSFFMVVNRRSNNCWSCHGAAARFHQTVRSDPRISSCERLINEGPWLWKSDVSSTDHDSTWLCFWFSPCLRGHAVVHEAATEGLIITLLF